MYELIPLIFVVFFLILCVVIAWRQGKANVKKDLEKHNADMVEIRRKYKLSKRTKV